MSGRGLAVATSALALVAVGSGAEASSARPITIGVLADCVSAYAPYYTQSLAGVELPLLERGAKLVAGTDPTRGLTGALIAGHPIRLVFGCTNGEPLSTLAEARRLVEALGADIVIGPTSADEEPALQEYARRRPEIAFVNGSSAGLLLDPAPNFFTFHADGAQWVAGLGSYAYHRLGWRRVVVIVNTDNFDWLQSAGFEAEFCSLGGAIAKRIWFFPATDFSGVLGQIPRRHVDGFFVQSYTDVEKSLVQHYPGMRGDSARRVLGGALSEPGYGYWANVRGQVIASPNGTPRARAAFEARLYRALPEINRARLEGDIFAPDYYGAMAAALHALDTVKGDLSQREQRFQAALARTQLDTPSGHVSLDADHQAITRNYLWRINKPDGSDKTLIRVITGVDHTFGGYFTKHDPAPSELTPACRRGHVPPWARSG